MFIVFAGRPPFAVRLSLEDREGWCVHGAGVQACRNKSAGL
jgi:hypothetical protein